MKPIKCIDMIEKCTFQSIVQQDDIYQTWNKCFLFLTLLTTDLPYDLIVTTYLLC